MCFWNLRGNFVIPPLFYLCQKRMNIHIAIVTVPKQDAQDICDLLVKSGIKGIWNFSPVNLKVPDNVKVRNEDLSSSLAVLLKQMNDNE